MESACKSSSFCYLIRIFKETGSVNNMLWTITLKSTPLPKGEMLLMMFAYATVFAKYTTKYRNSRPEVFLEKGVLKICSKFTGQHPCQSAISIKLQNNFIEIALRHGCSVVNLLHILRTSFPKNSSGWLFLKIVQLKKNLIKWKNFQNGLSLWKLQEMRSM